MFKYLLLIAVLCCFGCQTPHSGVNNDTYVKASVHGEKISVRVEKYASSYDVEVQRAVKVMPIGSLEEEWSVIAAPRVNGYPEKWMHTDAAVKTNGYAAKSSYLLNGEIVEISLEPGVHLIAKVLPIKQNTARVLGVIAQSTMASDGLEVISVPFDLVTGFGELNVVHLEKIDLAAVKQIADE